jgi:hypothetical protein
MIPGPKSSTCPACGGEIVSHWILAGPWPGRIPSRVFCYSCGAALLVRRSYFVSLYFVSLAIMILGAYAIGLGGYDFLAVVGFGVLPVCFLIVFLSLRLFPIELEESTASHVELLHFLADRGLRLDDGDREETLVPGRELKLEQIEGPRIFDAVARIGLIALYAFLISKAVIAVLDRVIPPAVEIMNAQEGFPLRAELRQDTIAFTNMSDEEWRCEILLGSSAQVGAAFQLPSHQTREIAYADFRPSLLMIRSAQLRSAARKELLARCTEPSGLFRSGLLR